MATWGIMGDDGVFYPNGVGYNGANVPESSIDIQALQGMPVAQMNSQQYQNPAQYDIWAAQQYQNPVNYDDMGNYYGPPLRGYVPQSTYVPRSVGYGVQSMYNSPPVYQPVGNPYQGPGYGPVADQRGNVVYGSGNPYQSVNNPAALGRVVSSPSQGRVSNITDAQRANLAAIGVYMDENGKFHNTAPAASRQVPTTNITDTSKIPVINDTSKTPVISDTSKTPVAQESVSSDLNPVALGAKVANKLRENGVSPISSFVQQGIEDARRVLPYVYEDGKLFPHSGFYPVETVDGSDDFVNPLTYYADRSPLAKKIIDALALPPSEQK